MIDRADMVNIVESVVARVLQRISGERRYVRIATAALWFDYEPRELRERCIRGEILGAVKEGKEWRIPVASLERMLRAEEEVKIRRKRKGVRIDEKRGVGGIGRGTGRAADGEAEAEAGRVCRG